MDQSNNQNVTIIGTDIDLVKRKNDKSGMTYNEAKAYIARTTGGYHTRSLSTTDIEAVRKQNEQSQAHQTHS